MRSGPAGGGFASMPAGGWGLPAGVPSTADPGLVNFEIVTADPRIAGLDREIGSTVAVLSSGAVSAVYTKVGSVSTQWAATGPLSTYDLWRQRMRMLTGLPAQTAGVYEYFTDFEAIDSAATPNGWRAGHTGTGAGNIDFSEGGGIVTVSSGATASSLGSQYRSGALCARTDTKRWGFACRFKITTAVDAQATLWLGVQNPANTITIYAGYASGFSATNFIVQYDGNRGGSALNLGVAVDTAWHVVEVYCLGDSKVRARIDGGSEVASGTVTTPITTGAFPTHEARNGSTAAARTVARDWWYELAERS